MSRHLCAMLLPVFFWPPFVMAEPAVAPVAATTAAPTAEITATVTAALQALDATNLDDDWSFTMDVAEEGELRVIRSDPQRDKYQKRQLIMVNGVAPDEDRQEAFYEAEVERIDALDPETTGYASMVDVHTLQLLETADNYVKLSFVPRVKALEDSRDKIRGTLRLDLASQQIEQIEITNIEPLSPAFSVSVDTYRLTLDFAPQQGETLLRKLESQAAGKAGFLKSFDSLVVIDFSDYERAAP